MSGRTEKKPGRGGRRRAASTAGLVATVAGIALAVTAAVQLSATPEDEQNGRAGESPSAVESLPPYRAVPAVTVRGAGADPASSPRRRIAQQQELAGEGRREQRRPPTAAPGLPRTVSIPKLGVRAPTIGVTAPGGTLTPPSDPRTLGWWSDGARPGSRRGTALVTGHTVSTGGGALDDLERLRAGDTVLIRTSKGSVRYVVRRVSTYRKASLARHAETLFSQGVPGRLALVTCEDWDGEKYLSNVVVIAEPVHR